MNKDSNVMLEDSNDTFSILLSINATKICPIHPDSRQSPIIRAKELDVDLG